MEQFRKKQKRVKRIMSCTVIATALYFLVYIGLKPSFDSITGINPSVFIYAADLLVVISLISVLYYYSKYSKCDSFLSAAEDIINDAGYYLTSRTENSIQSYLNAVSDDLKSNGYKLTENVTCKELTFDLRAYKGSRYLYFVTDENITKQDIIAYKDSAVEDVTAVNFKRKGNAAVVFICDAADREAAALSKDILTLGRKKQLTFATAIAERSTGRVYFLGNREGITKSLIAEYVMNCEIPIKDKYIGKEKLDFQLELKDRLADFTYEEFIKGKYI